MKDTCRFCNVELEGKGELAMGVCINCTSELEEEMEKACQKADHDMDIEKGDVNGRFDP